MFQSFELMIEVFKTNVKTQHQADRVVKHLHKSFVEYKINFDLEDCDKILRVEYKTGIVQSSGIINLLTKLGIEIQVLEDELSTEDDYKFAYNTE